MQGGFSFCGTDIAELGQEYVPDNANTYVYAGASYKVHEHAFDGHDGGYFYGTTTGIKTFVLRCIYQESNINDGILTRIEKLFSDGKTGRLVFQKRPWVYYVATVTRLHVGSITNYLNGFVTIEMKSYYPYGRFDEPFYPVGYEFEKNMIANSNMQPETMASPTVIVENGSVLASQREITLYNGGTRNAPVAIEIAGDVGEGVIITNSTTGQKMSIVGLTKEATTDQGKYLVCDAMTGKTIITDGTTCEDAYFYHDYGFIDLAPNEVIERDRYCSASGGRGGYVLASNLEPFPDECIGNYIYVIDSWRKITGWDDPVNKTSLLVSPKITWLTKAGYMTVATMNHITVTPVSSMRLTKLNFVYKPTFA